jgi:hypothetical protein
MARTKAAENSSKVSSDYPKGKYTVTWQDIDEDDWWLIINLIRGRIEYFQSRLNDIIRTNDPDLIHNQTDWYRESVEKLTIRLNEFEDQISPTYFKRKREEKAVRMRQPNM